VEVFGGTTTLTLGTRLRGKLATLGIASALVTAFTIATTAAAAPVGQTINFTLSTNNDVTTIVTCPPGTPANIVMCGYAVGTQLQASNTSGDKALSGTVSESFVSELAAPAATTTCAAAMADQSVVTIQTSNGNLLLNTIGSFCTVTGQDVENFTVVGGTGEYQGATGSGVIKAQQTSATAVTETYTGSVVLAH
jgi:hypothetical protein